MKKEIPNDRNDPSKGFFYLCRRKDTHQSLDLYEGKKIPRVSSHTHKEEGEDEEKQNLHTHTHLAAETPEEAFLKALNGFPRWLQAKSKTGGSLSDILFELLH